MCVLWLTVTIALLGHCSASATHADVAVQNVHSTSLSAKTVSSTRFGGWGLPTSAAHTVGTGRKSAAHHATGHSGVIAQTAKQKRTLPEIFLRTRGHGLHLRAQRRTRLLAPKAHAVVSATPVTLAGHAQAARVAIATAREGGGGE